MAPLWKIRIIEESSMEKDIRNPIVTIETDEYVLEIYDPEDYYLNSRIETIVYM